MFDGTFFQEGSFSEHVFPVDMAASLLTLLVVAVLSYYSWWKRSEASRIRKIVRDGTGASSSSSSLPTPLPVLPRWFGFVGGHTFQMESEKMIEQLEQWAGEFGGDYELHLLGKRTIVVTGLADIRRILTLRPSKFKRGLSPTQLHWGAGKLGVIPSMFFDEGKEWGRSRRLISPSLNGHNVAAMIPIMSQIGERLCAVLGEGADAGEVMDATSSFKRFTHDIIALAAFGLDADSVRATTDRSSPSFAAMSVIMSAFMRLVTQPFAMLGWVAFPAVLPWVRRTKRSSKQLQDVVQETIDKMRRETKDGGSETASRAGGDAAVSGGTLLRKVVAATKDGDSATRLSDRMTFSDDELLRQVKSLFIAGTETTALTLSWTMYYLAKHPKMLLRCRQEALRAAPLSDGMVSTDEQLSQLEFCSAIFKETLRLKGPAAFLFLHNTEAITMKSGMELDEGTAFAVMIRYAALSEEAFTRAKDFVPERWIETEREVALFGEGAVGDDRSINHNEEAWLSFGGGPRICPGQDMANTEASIILAAICARFDVSLAPGQADPPEEIMTFTAGPKAVRLVLTPRTV